MSDDQTNIGESIREADRAASALATLDAMEAMRRDGWLVVLKTGPDYGNAWRCDAIRHDVYMQLYHTAETPFDAVDGVRVQAMHAAEAKGE